MAPAGGMGRVKRMSDLLDEKVKARLRGDDCRLADYVSSSGSEHDGGADLSGFVDGFFFSDVEDNNAKGGKGEDADAGSAGSDGEGDLSPDPVPVVAMVRDLLKLSAGDRFRRDLVKEVTEAGERLAGLRSNRPAFRRAVMTSLREAGYNAGICKARWESRGGLAAGCYEYVDVVREPPETSPSPQQQPQQRYLVDVEFAGEFEIARPTAEYARVAAELPRVYVGKPEELKRLLRLLAEAAKRSLRAREMHVPPWRKGRYMQAKWLGSYRRTINHAPSGASPAAAPPPSPPSFAPALDMKCRWVGFDAAAAAGAARSVFPPATRTR